MFKSLLKKSEKEPSNILLRDVVNIYDYYFIDLWGVMHNGKQAFPKAVDAVNQLLNKGKTVTFLSNMPRPKELVIKTMTSYGVIEGFNTLTSGDSTRDYLMKNYKDKKVFHFGSDVNEDICVGLDLRLVDKAEDAEVILLTFFADSKDDLTVYEKLCKKIADLKIPVICANPDQLATYGEKIRITAGYFAKKIESYGAHVHYIGKPYIDIYKNAYDLLNIDDSAKSLMIGDTLETDVLGGFNASMDTILTLSGITQKELLENNETILEFSNKRELPLPTYIMDELEF